MLHAYRTLTRCIGYACALGCFLAGTSTLAHAQDYPPYYSQASRVHIAATYARQQSIASGTAVVPVNTRARWTSADDSITRYRTSTINVPKSTLRIGALSAMSRGIMHPGFQAAILAAGFIYSQHDNSLKKPDLDNSIPNFDIPGHAYSLRRNGSLIISSSDGHDFNYVYNWMNNQHSHGMAYTGYNQISTGVRIHYRPYSPSGGFLSAYYTIESCNTPHCIQWANPDIQNPEVGQFDPNDFSETDYISLDPEDYPIIDTYIPPSLYDELWNGEPIPEWQDTISVLGSPATGVSADGALSPELADAVGRWGENMDAQYNGDEAPHTDHPTTGNTAQDQVAEESLDGDIPSFPEPEVLWQTETVDLPSYSSGIGQGSCPAGVTIPLPLGANPLQMSYQPACDLATMVRPALIGICGLIALMIVLRARGGA